MRLAAVVLAAIIALAVVDASAEQAKPKSRIGDTWQRIQCVLWPHQCKPAPSVPPTIPAEQPKIEEHPPPAPKIEAEPQKKVQPKPTPPVERTKRKTEQMRETKPKRKVTPSTADCALIGLGISTLGETEMRKKARARGYSDSEISAAKKACGF